MEKTSLLGQWKDKKKTEATSNTIGTAPDGAVIPLSHSQRQLWSLQQLYPRNSFYNYTEEYKFSGDVHLDRLLDALKLVFSNHDILRTVYISEDGRPSMRTVPDLDIKVSRHDLRHSERDVDSAIKKIRDADATHSFDLSEPPVALVSTIRLKEDSYILVLTMHHIATDKWSMNLLRREWADYYRELSKGNHPEPRPPQVQYPDYAYWQRNRKIKWEQVDYWRGKLSGDIPIIDLPTDFPRPRKTTFKGRSSDIHYFSRTDSKAIFECCKQLGVTPYVFFLTVYYLFLHRYTGQKDILIGSPVSNRDQKVLEDTIGFFNDTMVLRTEIPSKGTFIDLVGAVKKTTLEAFSNKDVPFDFLVRELKQGRSLSVNPFFQVMFLYYSVSEAESFGDAVKVTYDFYNPGVSKFDLTFDVAEENGMLSFAFEYSTELFSQKTISRFHKHIVSLINGAVAKPESPLSKIEMLTAKERESLLPGKRRRTTDLSTGSGGQGTGAFEEFTGIHQGIEKMAATQPEATAVSFRDSRITYGELNDKANLLAVRILEKTKGENAIVGLCITRSSEMIIGLYAILKAGCAYMPIDPKYPSERIALMLGDAKVKMLVTQKELSGRFDTSTTELLFVEDISMKEDTGQVEMPVPKSDDIAYLIYTSGSTGRPKGVPITHGNILNSTAGRLDFYPENPKAFLLLSSISFDSSKAGIFWTLCTGGNLIVTEDRIEQDMPRLANIIEHNKVTHTLLLPTLYQLLLEHADTTKLKSLTTVMVAGEACSVSLTRSHFERLPETGLYNEYGPTEASVWCIAHKIRKNDVLDTVPLGRPVANAEIYLLDAEGNLVPSGAVGEIYIGGGGLSNGYLNRPELTAKAFVHHPFSDGKGARLYKTGDLARYHPNGDIEFLGRSDQQVKIRGYRVELEEIEKAIRAVADVSQVVVLAEDNGNASKRIVTYLTADESIKIPELKISLKNTVPDYMVPAAIVQVAEMPLLPNGKIDTSALQEIKPQDTSEKPLEVRAPSTELESKLHAIWSDLLKQNDIGVHDNFFELGGDSILSIQFIAKARKTGIDLTPNQIFDNQTIASLANYIESKEKQIAEWDYLVALRKQGSEKPLFCIHAGGGHVFFYNILTKYINANRPIYALQASGVYADMEVHHSIEAMAKDYIEAVRAVQPEGPYNILVYCFSVAVGHEMSIQLQEAGQRANLIVMDTMTDPWKLDTGDRLRMRIKSFAKRLVSSPFQTIRGMIGERVIGLRLKLRKMMSKGDDKALARLNDNLARICSRYAWRPHQEKVTLLLTQKPDETFNKEVIGSWKKVALGGVDIVPTDGNHIDLFAEPEVAGVAEKIEENCV